MSTIEERLTAVERDLADLRDRMTQQDGSQSWIERIAGTFKDAPEFHEIVRLGREFAKSVT